jgi:hypothetical protein
MPDTSCNSCGTPRADDGTWCLRCFAPFPDAPTEVTASQPVEAVATVADLVPAQPTPAVATPAIAPAASSYDFIARPPSAEDAPAMDSRFVWGDGAAAAPPARIGTFLPDAPRQHAVSKAPRASLRLAAIATVLLVVAGGLGGLVWWKAQPHGEKADIAQHFTSGRPALALPGFDAGLAGLTSNSDAPDTVQNNAAQLQPIDAAIRTANGQIVTTQHAFAQWAQGKLTDDGISVSIRALAKTMADLSDNIDGVAYGAPRSLATGLTKLSHAAFDYDASLSELDDYLLSQSRSARVGYWLGVARANEEWDSGLLSTYRSAGQTPPPLPHKR